MRKSKTSPTNFGWWGMLLWSEPVDGIVEKLSQTADKFLVCGAGGGTAGTDEKILAPDGIVPVKPGSMNGLANGVFHAASVFAAA